MQILDRKPVIAVDVQQQTEVRIPRLRGQRFAVVEVQLSNLISAAFDRFDQHAQVVVADVQIAVVGGRSIARELVDERVEVLMRE